MCSKEKQFEGILGKRREEGYVHFDTLIPASHELVRADVLDERTRLIRGKEDDGEQPEQGELLWRVIIEKKTGDKIFSQATIKLFTHDGILHHKVADGDGPVHALDNALRKILDPIYPALREVRLTNYKVQVLDSSATTASKVHVEITSTDGSSVWITEAVHENIIQASWLALVDSLEFKLFLWQQQN